MKRFEKKRAKRTIIASQKARRFAQLAQILTAQNALVQDDNLNPVPLAPAGEDAR